MQRKDLSHPAVSVIIPAYNQAAYLPQAIQSVLDQIFPDFELVVVDDGSTDETPQVLTAFRDSRLNIIQQVNSGLSAARNTGLRNSTAPLVTFLDSDDYYYPETLANLKDFLDNHPEIGMVSGGFEYVDQKGSSLRKIIKSPGKVDLYSLLINNPFTATSVMVRRSWFDRVGLFDERLQACEDWDLWLRFVYAGCRFAWIEKSVVAYRSHQGQMTREAARMRKAMLLMLDKFFNQPGLPQPLLAYKKKAYASALVKAAAYAYHSNECDRAQDDLAEAIQLDHTLKEDHYTALIKTLVSWSSDPRSTDPVGFLQRIISNPPTRQPGLRRQLRRASADVILAPFFSNSQEYWRSHRSELFTVIRYKPEWLLNRGVLRMVIDAWLHW